LFLFIIKVQKYKNFFSLFRYIMVLSNASKAARHQASLVNRPNCGGTAKKAGIAPSIGWFLQSNSTLRRAPQSMSFICTPSTTIQTQKYGYRATLGGV
jgi:hypothetical protein